MDETENEMIVMKNMYSDSRNADGGYNGVGLDD